MSDENQWRCDLAYAEWLRCVNRLPLRAQRAHRQIIELGLVHGVKPMALEHDKEAYKTFMQFNYEESE